MKASLLLATIGLAGCSFVTHPIDNNSRTVGKLKHTPEIRITLSTSDQVCVGKTGTAEVVVYIFLLNIPAQTVKVVVNGGVWEHDYYGNRIIITFQKVNPGTHYLDAYVGDRTVHKSFSVWNCSAT